jgi:hypothetical protein
MTTANFTREDTSASLAYGTMHLDEVVETIRDDALAAAKERLRPAASGLDSRQLMQRADFAGCFLYRLAASVAQTLAALDERVLAVYTYDPSGNPCEEAGLELPPDNQVHLLVLVSAPSAALDAFTAALDRALTASLKELALCCGEHESVLDVCSITEADVRAGRGLAGLLGSIFAPPIKIWQRAR